MPPLVNPDSTFSIVTAPKRNSFHWTPGTVTWAEMLTWLDDPASGQCWEYKRAKANSDGYGMLPDGRMAHRFSWEYWNRRPVPESLVVCHTCDNPPCVNPSHLWVGTTQQNTADRHAKGRSRGPRNGTESHCLKGHQFDEKNTYSKYGKRYCRTCRREYMREYRKAMK